MFAKSELKNRIRERGLTVTELSEKTSIPKTSFYRKMNTGEFSRAEIERIIDFLQIENPEKIFFAKVADGGEHE